MQYVPARHSVIIGWRYFIIDERERTACSAWWTVSTTIQRAAKSRPLLL
jgi:hypothetical protein